MRTRRSPPTGEDGPGPAGADGLERLVRETIPLATAMDVRVVLANDEELRLTAPLGANANPHGTIFGGSAAALAILAGWGLVKMRLLAEGSAPTLVIQHIELDFLAPAHDDLEARAAAPEADDWGRFVRTLARRGRARIAISVTLRSSGGEVGRLTGRYVALEGEG